MQGLRFLRVSGSRSFAALPVIVAVALLGACTTGRPIEPGLAVTAPDPSYGQEPFAYQIRENYPLNPTDIVQISVFREPDLSFDSVMLNSDGQVVMPLLGPVQLAGLTPTMASERLEELYGTRYLRNPQVSVNIREFASHRVTVEGKVENPGVFEFQPGTRLSGGIALANGTTRVADLQDVAVFRQVEGGMAVAKFDYAAVRSGQMLDPVLMPGDRVVVGTSELSQAWQDFLQAVPVFALFTRF
nr:polysaccharide biosynthesis/export family protein [Aurantiacibacter odishensis]